MAEAPTSPSKSKTSSEPDINLNDIRVQNKYRIGRKIGSGSFGDIYIGTNIINGEEVAIKLEKINAPLPQLLHEAKVYESLKGGVGVPSVRWYGTEGEYNCMVMDLLGPSLEDLFNFCGRKFTLKTVLLLADQLISRIEYIHSKNYLHRDIKLENIMFGRGTHKNEVYLIDYGLAKMVFEPSNGRARYRETSEVVGNGGYASINTHLGVEQSRRDDLEALGYLLVHLCRGSLPWEALIAGRIGTYDAILDKKVLSPPEVLCRGLPVQFQMYFRQLRSLPFSKKPDYSTLRGLFCQMDADPALGHFDWVLLKDPKDSNEDEDADIEYNASRGEKGSSADQLGWIIGGAVQESEDPVNASLAVPKAPGDNASNDHSTQPATTTNKQIVFLYQTGVYECGYCHQYFGNVEEAGAAAGAPSIEYEDEKESASYKLLQHMIGQHVARMCKPREWDKPYELDVEEGDADIANNGVATVDGVEYYDGKDEKEDSHKKREMEKSRKKKNDSEDDDEEEGEDEEEEEEGDDGQGSEKDEGQDSQEDDIMDRKRCRSGACIACDGHERPERYLESLLVLPRSEDLRDAGVRHRVHLSCYLLSHPTRKQRQTIRIHVDKTRPRGELAELDKILRTPYLQPAFSTFLEKYYPDNADKILDPIPHLPKPETPDDADAKAFYAIVCDAVRAFVTNRHRNRNQEETYYYILWERFWDPIYDWIPSLHTDAKAEGDDGAEGKSKMLDIDIGDEGGVRRGRCVVCLDLSCDVGEEELRTIASHYGKIIRSDIFVTGNTFPRYAFIEFENKREAEACREGMHDTVIDGRNITVEFADAVKWLYAFSYPKPKVISKAMGGSGEKDDENPVERGGGSGDGREDDVNHAGGGASGGGGLSPKKRAREDEEGTDEDDDGKRRKVDDGGSGGNEEDGGLDDDGGGGAG
ncbi:serine/threonine protein kinase [Rhizophlyctis rosea]|nr:serine/threonine protein kinase [Rhizophlyctis rosea]